MRKGNQKTRWTTGLFEGSIYRYQGYAGLGYTTIQDVQSNDSNLLVLHSVPLVSE